MAKSVVKLDFSLHPLPVISSPKPPFFIRFGHFGGKNRLLRGYFSLQLARNSRPKSHFAPKKSVWRGFLLAIRPKYDFCRRKKEESRRFFILPQTEQYQNGERGAKTRKPRTKKHKAITEKPKDKIKKQTYYTEKTKHNRARQVGSHPLPHSVRKIQADFLSKRPHFSRLPPLFLSKPPYPAQNPFHPTRRTRAYAYIRARALTEFAIFAFTLHLTAQQSAYQLVECEGKPCIHLHIHRNNLKNNTLHDFHCKKTVKAKGWSLHPQLTLAQHLSPKRWRGEGKNRKTLDARVRVRK